MDRDELQLEKIKSLFKMAQIFITIAGFFFATYGIMLTGYASNSGLFLESMNTAINLLSFNEQKNYSVETNQQLTNASLGYIELGKKYAENLENYEKSSRLSLIFAFTFSFMTLITFLIGEIMLLSLNKRVS